MNKTILKVAFAAACLLGLQGITFSSLLMAEEQIPLILHDGSTTTTQPHRNPALTPIVEINDVGTQLTFTGTAAITFSVVIEDEDGNAVLSDVLAVQQNAQTYLSIASLPAGDYTLYVIIDDNAYVGEFCK